MKVGTEQGNYQLEKDTKVLSGQGYPIDDITFIISVLNPSYLLLHLSLILMMAMKVTEASLNVRDRGVDQENLDIFSEINSNNLVSTNVGQAISGHWRYG